MLFFIRPVFLEEDVPQFNTQGHRVRVHQETPWSAAIEYINEPVPECQSVYLHAKPPNIDTEGISVVYAWAHVDKWNDGPVAVKCTAS